MGKLSDILGDGSGNDIRKIWDDTDAADEFGPLPAGEYQAHIIAGGLFTGRTKATPGYKLTFKVCDGDHTGRQFWHDIWLTPAALPMAKRDLGKIGIQSLDQLEQPLPARIRCRVKLALRREDDGTEYNKVSRFDALGVDPPEPDAFAPADAGSAEDDVTPDDQPSETKDADQATADDTPF